MTERRASQPRIAILGAGANGAGIGADLITAGHDVTFVEQWPAHVEAMRARGVRVELPDRVIEAPVRVHHLCEVAQLREPYDIVFLLVKAYDTRWAAELIRPLVAVDGVIVGLQNGMTAGDIAAAVGEERTVAAVIEVSSALHHPGIVERHTGPDHSWFAVGGLSGTGPHDAAVAGVLSAAGTVVTTSDIRSAKWMKLVVNAAELVTSAIVGLPMLPAAQLEGMRQVMTEAGREALLVGLALGRRAMPIFGMPAFDSDDPCVIVDLLIDQVYSNYALPHTTTTVLQDWSKGRRSEVSEINGLVSREGRTLGIGTPVNDRIVEVALRIEAGELAPSPQLLPLLTEALA